MVARENEFFGLFVEESTEQIEKIEQGILKLEEGYSEETIKEVFRMAHSLKGSSTIMGFAHLSEFTHNMESLLEKIKTRAVPLNEEVIDLLFECVDKIKEMRDNITKSRSDEVDITKTCEKITSFVGKKKTKRCSKNTSDEFSVTEYELLVMDDAVRREQNVFIIKVGIEEDASMKSMKAFLAVNNLKNLGQVLRVWPHNYDTADDSELNNGFKVVLITSQSKEKVEKNIDAAGEIKSIIIDSFKGKESEGNNIDVKVNEKLEDNLLFRTEKRSYIRVDIAKLDKLMGFVGELVIDNGRLSQVAGKLKARFKGDPDIKELLETVEHVDYIGSEIQDAVMNVRVYTVENIFNKFHRMIRDLSKRSNKEISFITEGENTELDRGILEEIVDPLVHLIRNAVDHGIETVEERLEKGKAAQGTINLKAKHQENNVIIEISDDGKGLDINSIKSKALEKGLVTIDDVETMSDQEAVDLIFLPGFSTAKIITDISGRGVGMDVVKTNVEKMNGVIEIETEKNKGTRFIIKLPLTLAIIQVLLVKEGNLNFALPLSSVVETIRLSELETKEYIKKVKGKKVYIWEDQIIPIIRLGDYYEVKYSNDNSKTFLIIAGFSQKYVCFMAERLVGEQQIVIKSLGEYLGKGKLLGEVKGISGATILGDGSFAYVMDIPELLKDLKSAEHK